MASQKTESQKYSLIKQDREFEIRYYPSATMAKISSTAKTYKELSSPGFRKLAGYIFGGNQEGKQIAMTIPVHMNFQEEGSSMAFVMPSKWDSNSLPKPNDPGIEILTSPEEYVAAIRFGGFASDGSMQKHKDLLETWLKKEGIPFYGNFRFLGYNPPFQLMGRRNEIIIAIDWKNPEKP